MRIKYNTFAWVMSVLMVLACEKPAQTGADEPDLPNIPFE